MHYSKGSKATNTIEVVYKKGCEPAFFDILYILSLEFITGTNNTLHLILNITMSATNKLFVASAVGKCIDQQTGT